MDPGTILAVVQISAKVISILSKYYSDVKKARSDIERLTVEIQTFHDVLQNIQRLVQRSGAKLPAASVASAEKCHNDIIAIEETLNPTSGRKAMRRVGLRALKWPFTSAEVNEYIEKLDRHKATLNLALNSDQTSLILGIDEGLVDLRYKQGLAEQDQQLNRLPQADGAAYNSFHRQHERQCIPDTRVDLLEQLDEWSKKQERCIFWLNGMAGTGKSTIARTIASKLDDRKSLGASFFFSRGVGDLGHAERFVTSLAYQLAIQAPALRGPICKAIISNPDIARQGLRNQWKALIVQPLTEFKGQDPSLNLVIDALDECANEDNMKLILQLFVELKNLGSTTLGVIVTSRPETPINLGFKNIPEVIYQDLVLHDVPRSIVEHDISVFLKFEFTKIREKYKLQDWPNERQIQSVLHAADCVFIYAATVCRFIDDPNWLPDERLDLILQGSDTEGYPYAKLDEMYTQVLKSAVPKSQSKKEIDDYTARFKNIVGSIVVLLDVLSVSALANLLSLATRRIEAALHSLYSLLNVPKTLNAPIRLLHPSFRDFLLNSERCKDESFQINGEIANRDLASSCLGSLTKTLKKNLCELDEPGRSITEIRADLIDKHFPNSVRYACQYWVEHLEQTTPEHYVEIGLCDGGLVDAFFDTHLLHWFEALGILNKMSEGVKMLKILEKMIQDKHCPSLLAKVQDAQRFLLNSRSILEETPLQVYSSALVFSPEESLTKIQYRNEIPNWITIYPRQDTTWNSCLQILETHFDNDSVAFSPDGKQLASASDEVIQLWDPATGALCATLEGHSDPVNSVVFSPDGKQLASASDEVIQLWDPATGTLCATLEGHSGSVNSIVFSPDGKQLAYALDKAIQLWDLATGTLYATLEGHSSFVNSVVFSPDGRLASALDDGTIQIWDWATGVLRTMLKGHYLSVDFVVFSPGGRQPASASENNAARLWDPTTKIRAVRATLEGHSECAYSVAFSPDGKQLASTSWDKTIRLWDPVTGALFSTLEGHADCVNSVAFSPDGKQLASTSWDKTIRLWDPVTGALFGTLEGHYDRVNSVAFSPDGKQLASASSDRTIRIWDPTIKMGAIRVTLEGHSKLVHSVAFSPDGTQLVSASSDKTVRLWDVKSAIGTLRATLEGHDLSKDCVVFSPDGKQLASAYFDGTIRIWDLTNKMGVIYVTLKGHSDWVTSVAFSPDGKQLASASHDKTVRLWDVIQATLMLRVTLEGHSGWVTSVAFSPDGKQLASASRDKTVRLWDIEKTTGLLHATLEGHSTHVLQVAFSPDGNRLVSASVDGVIRIWDPATKRSLLVLDCEYVGKLLFSADGLSLQTDSHFFDLSSISTNNTHHGLPSLTSPLWWISRDNWLCRDSVRVFWLHPDYRPRCWTISGNVFGIGTESGRVFFINLNLIAYDRERQFALPRCMSSAQP